MEKNEKQSKVEVTAKFSPISWPLLGDVFLVGKKNPLGKNAAMNIAEMSSPGRYRLKTIENNPEVEALLIHKDVLIFLDEETLVKYVLEQVTPFPVGGSCLRINISTELITKGKLSIKG